MGYLSSCWLGWWIIPSYFLPLLTYKNHLGRWRGKNFNRSIAEFGENVVYLKTGSVGKDKFNSRWEEGVWLGISDESGESIIGTKEGVIKARDFRRKAIAEERWNKEHFTSIKGTPWEPNPGRESDYRVQSRVIMPDVGPITAPARGRDRLICSP